MQYFSNIQSYNLSAMQPQNNHQYSCTYCCAKKDNSSGFMPAINRYQSERINWLYESCGHQYFLIFSGQYGLLRPSDQIPYYDHLLIESEVIKHSDIVRQQLKQKNIKTIRFYHNSIKSDPNLIPYLNCVRLACQQGKVKLTFEELPAGKFTD